MDQLTLFTLIDLVEHANRSVVEFKGTDRPVALAVAISTATDRPASDRCNLFEMQPEEPLRLGLPNKTTECQA